MDLLHTLMWYWGNILDYTKEAFPCVVLALVMFGALVPLRRRRLAAQGLHSGFWREGGLLLFVVFCAGLTALTLFPSGFWSSAHLGSVLRGETSLFPPVDWSLQLQTLQLTPLREIWRAFRGPWVMFLMLANIGIFIPIGFFPALLWRNWRLWKAGLLGCLVSCSIECIQFFIGRSTDIDDVILNTTETILGFSLFCLIRRLFPQFVARFQCAPISL